MPCVYSMDCFPKCGHYFNTLKHALICSQAVDEQGPCEEAINMVYLFGDHTNCPFCVEDPDSEEDLADLFPLAARSDPGVDTPLPLEFLIARRQYFRALKEEERQKRLDRKREAKLNLQLLCWVLAITILLVNEVANVPRTHRHYLGGDHIGASGIFEILDFFDLEEDYVVCSICREPFAEESDIVRLPCHHSHFFDRDCCMRWLESNNTCPICRHPYRLLEQFRLNFYADESGESESDVDEDEDDDDDEGFDDDFVANFELNYMSSVSSSGTNPYEGVEEDDEEYEEDWEEEELTDPLYVVNHAHDEEEEVADPIYLDNDADDEAEDDADDEAGDDADDEAEEDE